jgi:3D (Asp-Asp-Asp) domain-containing protein
MKNLAGGSVFLGVIALLVTAFFYFQPTVEAVTLASNSPNNLLQQQFINQDELTIQQQKQSQAPTNVSDKKIKKTSAVTNFMATAYCLRGRTATGGSVRRGIVAADPRVLPLGSRIQISAGAYSGIYTVTDTGGSVKGRKIDIWMGNCSEANRFGSRSITVSRL